MFSLTCYLESYKWRHGVFILKDKVAVYSRNKHKFKRPGSGVIVFHDSASGCILALTLGGICLTLVALLVS